MTFNLEPHVALDIFETMLHDAGVTVFFEAQVATVHKIGTRIQSITLGNGSTITSKFFIDASTFWQSSSIS